MGKSHYNILIMKQRNTYRRGDVFAVREVPVDVRIRFRLLSMALKLPGRLLIELLVNHVWEHEKDKVVALGQQTATKKAHRFLETAEGFPSDEPPAE